MIWALVITAVALFLLRGELKHLRPHWRGLVAFVAGVLAGWVFTVYLARLGFDRQVASALGISSLLFRLIFAVFSGFVLAGPGKDFLDRLFPEE